MDISIGGYSFHLALESGNQDMFGYIAACKELGATQLDPWNAQLARIQNADDAIRAARDPERASLSVEDEAYLQKVRAAADAAGLPFGCIAVDGAHIYEDDPAAREGNRLLADRWLDVACVLGAKEVRIDAGGPEDMPGPIFKMIVAGYEDLLARAHVKGVEVLMENHWGPSFIPENVVRILEAVDGLGLLFDTNNWAPGTQERGWELCAKYAKSSHFKTFSFDDQGNDPSVNLAKAVRLLVDAGYAGCWGVESCPTDGDEYTAARKTIELIKRNLHELNAI